MESRITREAVRGSDGQDRQAKKSDINQEITSQPDRNTRYQVGGLEKEGVRVQEERCRCFQRGP